jgi:Fe2+ transport system protein B
MNILLVGNPNVGKSVVFSRLTGIHAISSNHPGTSVGYTKGSMKLGNAQADMIDVGFLRKDVALGMLARSDLTTGQLVVGSVVLAMFFPCIATFIVLLRELGVSGLLKSTGIMMVAALVTGRVLKMILN